MSVRTIGVKIDGLNDIENASKILLNMKKTVLDIEKLINKMGKSNSLPFIDLKLRLNTDEIEKQIKSINGLASKASGSGKSPIDEKALRRTSIEVHNVAESYKNLRDAVNTVDGAVTKLTSNMLKLGAVNPAKAMLGSFKSISSEVLNIQRSLASMVGGGLKSSLTGIMSGVRNSFSVGLRELNQEANNLGDAMQIYRINMQALGKNEKEINLSMKRLGDYGKASVFDATDLLEQASTFTAYNRGDAEDITRAFAGLTAQTKNPVQGMKTITTQVSQMLASGVLNQQDFRFIRERFSALGASEVNKRLTELANAKGESTVVDATRKRLISADEFLDIIKQVGGDPKFQELVTSIITPRQAIDNLKETLSNLFVFDKIDDEGNVTTGALNKVYIATREFIKGITDIVSSAKFEEYIRKFGDSIGDMITKFSQVGRVLGMTQGSALLSSMETFGKELAKGFSGKGFVNNLIELSKSIEDFFNTTGSSIGKFLGEAGNEYIKFLRSMVDVGKEGINKGFLDGITEVIKMYRNLADLAVSSGAVKLLAESFSRFFKVVNDVITTGANTNALKATVKSLGDFVKQLFDSIQFIGTKTTLIPTALGGIKSLLNFFTEVMSKIQKGINLDSVNTGLKKLGQVFDNLLKGLAPIVAELGSGLINAITSTTGVAFFKALGDFVKAVVTGIRNFFAQMGNGNVEAGMKRIINFFTSLVNLATTVVNIIGANARLFVNVLIFGKITSWVTKFVSFVGTVTKSLSQILGMSSNVNFALGSRSLLARQSSAMSSTYGPSGSTYGAPAMITAGAPQVGLLRGAYNSYKSARLDTGSRLQGLKAGFSSFKSGMNSNLLKGIGKGALFVGGLVGDMLIDGVNGMVQDSGANTIVKKGAQVVSTTAKGALYGAGVGSLFGPIGTTIGAGLGSLIGGVYGFFTKSEQEQRAEQEKELKKQVAEEEKKAKEERLKAKVEAIKEEGRAYSELLRGFYKSVGSNGESNLANSLSTVTGLASQTGMDVKNAKSSVGLANINPDFGRLADYNVDINGETRTWKEWREYLGVTDEDLLASLQLLYGSMGQKVFELKSSIDGSAITIQTLSHGESNRQQLNTDRFKNAVMSIWGGLDQTKEYLFKDLSTYSESLKSALEGKNFSSKDDQKEALIQSLKQVGISEEFLREQSRQNLIDYATKLQKSAQELSKSSQEANADAVGRITKNLKGLPENLVTSLQNYAEHASLDIVDQIDQLSYQHKDIKSKSDSASMASLATKLKAVDDEVLKSAESGANVVLEDIRKGSESKGDKKEHLSRLIQMNEKIDKDVADALADRMVEKGETLKEAVKSIEGESLSSEKLEALKTSVTNYFNVIGKMVSDGDLTIEQANALLYGIDITSIDTTQLDASGQKLLAEVKTKVDTTGGKIGEMKSKVEKNNPKDVDTSGIDEKGRGLKGALEDAGNAVTSFLSKAWDKVSSVAGDLWNGASKFVGGIGKRVGNFLSNPFGIFGRKATGGLIKYYSGGSYGGVDFVSRGTDTVPTMLTPGEYVLRKKAVDSLGTNFLDKLNKYGSSALQKGTGQTIINNVYNNNNAQISQNIDNKSQYLNGMYGIDKLMRYV